MKTFIYTANSNLNSGIMQDEILEMLVEKDDVSWQSILNELVRSEKMNPWDVDVSALSQKYLETVVKLKKMDFRISGKVLLAAALLLKFKSIKLVNDDISELDRLMAGDDPAEELYDDFYESLEPCDDIVYEEPPKLVPRTPQMRKRKVSVYDLVSALRKALEVKKRRVMRREPPEFEKPEKKRDISLVIKDIYAKISKHLSEKKKLYFSHLLETNSKEEKIMTFIPLLHLANERKIDLEQEKHFEDIEIKKGKV